METLSEILTPTILGQEDINPQKAVEIELLRAQPLTNEEIVELTAFFCQAESIEPYIEHVQVLRDRYDMTLEIRPLEIEIFSLREKFPLHSLRNFFIAIDDVGYHGLIKDVITLYQQDPSTAVYLLNLETVFIAHPDEEFIRDIIRFIENSEMDGPGINAAVHLFESKLAKISEYAPIPAYIKDFNIDASKLPRIEPSDIYENATPDIIAQYIQKDLENMGQYLEVPEGSTTQEILFQMVNDLDAEQYNELINKIAIDPEEVERIQHNPNIFRVYGPVNSYNNTDFSKILDENEQPDVNIIFGGARMFTDLSQEIDPETLVPLDEWFTGSCMQCFKRIRAYHHAVREPGLQGGWSGCFCNWDCVRGGIADGQSNFDFDDDIEDPNKFNMYAVQLAFTVKIENDMNDIFIADRDYDDDEGIVNIREEQLDEDFINRLKMNFETLNI
jgi:hypothetical protein